MHVDMGCPCIVLSKAGGTSSFQQYGPWLRASTGLYRGGLEEFVSIRVPKSSNHGVDLVVNVNATTNESTSNFHKRVEATSYAQQVLAFPCLESSASVA